jgi:hypothetical protein
MIHKTGIGLITFIVVSLFLLPSVFAEPNMREGMWEIKGKMQIEGTSFHTPPLPVNYTQCLTKKDMIPYKKEKNQDCKMIDKKIKGNEVTWIMECRDKNGVTESTGKITFKGRSFAGTVHSILKDNKDIKRVESNLQMSGKRTGDCK